ncbi:unnamed protein product [Protopolystoma xenopodis]|uniref:Uncharacterized protein n=1 Tax=Protopolystoma xenopodis TaxID=117903 RepID=A0A3S5FCR1_9PLAT|nr:unnamed protein product [Protopolystoma xenopodis]
MRLYPFLHACMHTASINLSRSMIDTEPGEPKTVPFAAPPCGRTHTTFFSPHRQGPSRRLTSPCLDDEASSGGDRGLGLWAHYRNFSMSNMSP